MKKHSLLMSCAVGALALSVGGAMAATAAATTTSTNTNAGTTIGELVITAERKEENLQSTPIAVSAFSQETLSKKGLNGGQDLLLQVPNTNFSRTNFGGYDFKIRGIGTDVIGAGGTAGVSVNENQLPVTANHFQDADFFDVQRVEVLRGPQGTLYGRNATGGAVDIITVQPSSEFGGYASFQYGNYNALKFSGAVNIPLGDTLAVRVAGIRQATDGFGVNSYLNKRVDGRDLGAIRATVSFKPSDRFSAYLMYEHFSEDDNRNRVGKQLCIKDPGPSSVGVAGLGYGAVPVASAGGPVASNYAAFLNQGCLQGSLYQPAAYGTLNSNSTLGGVLANLTGLNNGLDLFRNNPLQNTNLHDIQSAIQPMYRAQNDLVDFHMQWKVTDNLTLESTTGFNRNTGSSAEDYNRIVPNSPYTPTATGLYGPLPLIFFPNGVVKDPQTGTSNLITSFDYGTTQSKEYTQELRLASSFGGPLNFTAGGFYSELNTPFNAGTNYYVESNSLTAYTMLANFVAPPQGQIAIDPNYPPSGVGHNYYDSRTGGAYLKSYAGFGEVYYNFTNDLKLTLGGRYTVDQLYNLSYPIELVAPGSGFPTTICSGGVTTGCLTQQKVTYREFTGRANLQWTPTLSFTDRTLLYATYSRGYKGGGFNTPCQISLGSSSGVCPYPQNYNPEFIDAYEIGTKNTLLHNTLQLNLTGFYYNYSGYQISEIVAESSVNLNINAKIYGAEFEAIYSPVRNLTLNANIGVIHTAIANNTFETDQMNLTQGDANYTLLKTTAGANCLAPSGAAAAYIANGLPAYGIGTLCDPNSAAAQAFGAFYPHNGAGSVINPNQFGETVNIGGNQLPNTPPVTVSLGAQYVFELPHDWNATLRGDYYWQDNSYARIFNAVNDRLKSYDIVNATLTVSNRPMGIDVQFYVKNLFDSQPLTGVYLTDATSGLFQNVFTLDPRTFGVQLTKKW